MEINKIYLGNCMEVMKQFPDNSFHSMVTDPPYLLNFMNKEFDNQHKELEGQNEGQKMQNFHESWLKECFRIMVPGAYACAFGGTRTAHRLACAIEDTGFEIRDMISWVYSSGFPKNHNLGDGFGTALKPANEPIYLFRKPISEKNIKENIIKHGAGGININETRIQYQDWEEKANVGGNFSNSGKQYKNNKMYSGSSMLKSKTNQAHGKINKNGRWPANFILSHSPGCKKIGKEKIGSGKEGGYNYNGNEYKVNGFIQQNKPNGNSNYGIEEVDKWECEPDCIIKKLNEQSGFLQSGEIAKHHQIKESENLCMSGKNYTRRNKTEKPKSNGFASRFFKQIEFTPEYDVPFYYCAKAQKKEKNSGLNNSGIKVNDGRKTEINNPYQRGESIRQNFHPTVKPIKLIQYLIKLVTPLGGIALDPFLGSGTFALAAYRMGVDFIGIEKDINYFKLAQERLNSEKGLFQ